MRAIQARATETWGELYKRFRPLISAALARGGVPLAERRERLEAVDRVVLALEREVEGDRYNDCFADVLWLAVGRVVNTADAAVLPLRRRLIR